MREAARLHTVGNRGSSLATITPAASTTCGAATTAGLTQLVTAYRDDASLAVTLPFAFTYQGEPQ
jgi:hypothetical protein